MVYDYLDYIYKKKAGALAKLSIKIYTTHNPGEEAI